MHSQSNRLIEDASRGDKQAVEELLERFLPTVRAVVSRRMGRVLRSWEDSLDLVQSACRRALERVDQCQAKNDREFLSWLLEIVEHKMVDRYREHDALKRGAARQHQDLAPETGVTDSQAAPSQVAARKEAIDALYAAIDASDEHLRQALELSVFEGLSYEGIAERLDISPKQARLRVVKARSRLARELRRFERAEAAPGLDSSCA